MHNDHLLKMHEDIQYKKLSYLTAHLENGINTNHDPDKVIFNFSNHQLSEHEKALLCKGLEFAILVNR